MPQAPVLEQKVTGEAAATPIISSSSAEKLEKELAVARAQIVLLERRLAGEATVALTVIQYYSRGIGCMKFALGDLTGPSGTIV